MEPLQMTQTEIEMYIERAKNRYLQKHVYSERRFSRYLFFSVIFLVTGLIEGRLLVRLLNSIDQLVGGEMILTMLPAIVQLSFYFIFHRDVVSREKDNANKPANIIFMLREILEEDSLVHLPHIEGLHVFLNQFRHGELLRVNQQEDLEAIDRALEVVKRFRDAGRVNVEEVQNQRLQFIQSQLESTD